MTRDVVTVSPATSILEARRLMQRHHIRHLPVVVDGQVVGMLSDRDIVINDAPLNQALASLESDLVTGRYRRVQSVMTTPAWIVFPNDTIRCATELMVRRGVSALPVVDTDGVIGVISLTDCAMALACTTELRQEAAAFPEPDEDAMVPMPAGDDRPGRRRARPIAAASQAAARATGTVGTAAR